MLAANEHGLGKCWIGFAEHSLDTEEVKEKYSIPHNYKMVCPMVIGYPKSTLTPPSRKPAKVFYQK